MLILKFQSVILFLGGFFKLRFDFWLMNLWFRFQTILLVAFFITWFFRVLLPFFPIVFIFLITTTLNNTILFPSSLHFLNHYLVTVWLLLQWGILNNWRLLLRSFPKNFLIRWFFGIIASLVKTVRKDYWCQVVILGFSIRSCGLRLGVSSGFQRNMNFLVFWFSGLFPRKFRNLLLLRVVMNRFSGIGLRFSNLIRGVLRRGMMSWWL